MVSASGRVEDAVCGVCVCAYTCLSVLQVIWGASNLTHVTWSSLVLSLGIFTLPCGDASVFSALLSGRLNSRPGLCGGCRGGDWASYVPEIKGMRAHRSRLEGLLLAKA